MLEVLAPGFLTTVQDGGRPDAAAQGVPAGGACDRRSLAIANLLVGNGALDPALEITVAGPELVALETIVIGLAGADLGAWVPEEGRALRPGASHLVRSGHRIAFDPGRGRGPGCRAYLALPGGIDAPRFLGSASTYVPGGFGGLDGRPLRAGDRVRGASRRGEAAAGRVWPEARGSGPGGLVAGRRGAAWVMRVVSGPHATQLAGGARSMCSAGWEVAAASDRIGLRLSGPPLEASEGSSAARDDFVSIALPWGAVQVPPDGLPIVLLADHQTVGGYPVPTVVARVDLPLAGQLSPGDAVAFELVDVGEAQRAYRRDRLRMSDARAALDSAGSWDDLAQSAES